LSSSHSEQRPSWQKGVGTSQSLAERQATHSASGPQMGLSGGQLALDVHPSWHFRSPLQMGAAGGQSALVTHWTHVPSRAKQTGAAAPQSVEVRQATQDPVLGLQNGFGVAAHSVFDAQPRQAPVRALQIDASPGHMPAVQAA
jgi:hypothetical protein